MKLAPLMTTTVGSFPRPAWLAETDRSAWPNDLSSMSGHGRGLAPQAGNVVASALGRRRAAFAIQWDEQAQREVIGLAIPEAFLLHADELIE